MIFSVITPFYKGNQYLENLFRILKANEMNIKNKMDNVSLEFIIVNDSPDTKVVFPPNAEEVNCRVINQPINGGIHQARVTGLASANGGYILFLDQDDEVAEDFILKQYSKIGQNDLVVSNAYLENASMEKKVLYKNKNYFQKVLRVNTYVNSHNQIVSPGQCLIKKDAIPNEWKTYITRQNGSDDLFLWILLLVKKKRIALNDCCLYTHKYTGENLSASNEKMTESSLEIAEYLSNISWIPKNLIKRFVRSRKMYYLWESKSIKNKLKVIFTDMDLIIYRIIWKIRCMF